MGGRRLFLLLVAILASPAGCAKSTSEHTFLQAEDLQTADGAQFDPNEIVDVGSFTDSITLDSTAVQQLLAHTPYNRPSFLETYQSNGVRAADAILAAAQKYKLNPLVFLVRAETDQGLIGEQFYPQPPTRVEYAFGCGCPGVGACEPRLAGFDVQVDCLGRELRANLDAIAANGATAGGWAPNKASTTIDGVSVTPADASTAALYQYTPRVGQGSGGTWLFWNVWQNYAAAMLYVGPIGGPGPSQGGGAWVGDACTNDTDCTFPGATCAKAYPGGLCTTSCMGSCPSDPTRAPTFCASFQQTGLCLAVCNPSVQGSCRSGYTCVNAQQFGGTAGASEYVCAAQ